METIEYLGAKKAAAHVGIALSTWEGLKSRPEPDARIDRVSGWLPETLDEWDARRLRKPGSGSTTRRDGGRRES